MPLVQLNPPDVLQLTLFESELTVSSSPPFIAYFNGTVSAPASNSLLVYGFGSYYPFGSDPNLNVTFASIPPLSPGSSYSGPILNVSYTAYSVSGVDSDPISFFLLFGTADDPFLCKQASSMR